MSTAPDQEKISLEKCREHLKGVALSDDQVLELRDTLYYLAEETIDGLVSDNRIETNL